jgi:hypothetical protein
MAAEPLVQVEEVTWTGAVRDLQFTNRYPDGSLAPAAPIYLWTRMRASRPALAQLQSEGKLPIRHRWIRYLGTEPSVDTIKPTDQIGLSVGTSDLVRQLQQEVDDRGWFDWRTWSGKENVRPGKWRVDVVYKTGAPVLCGPNGGEPLEPCHFSIDIAQ